MPFERPRGRGPFRRLSAGGAAAQELWRPARRTAAFAFPVQSASRRPIAWEAHETTCLWKAATAFPATPTFAVIAEGGEHGMKAPGPTGRDHARDRLTHFTAEQGARSHGTKPLDLVSKTSARHLSFPSADLGAMRGLARERPRALAQKSNVLPTIGCEARVVGGRLRTQWSRLGQGGMSQGGAGDPFGLVLVAAMIALLEALQGGNPQPATRRKSGIEPPDGARGNSRRSP